MFRLNSCPLFSLEYGVFFPVWAFNRVSISVCPILKQSMGGTHLRKIYLSLPPTAGYNCLLHTYEILTMRIHQIHLPSK